jgi:hypothetical protein
MKLLNCLDCNDVVALLPMQDRKCYCGSSIGRYLSDGLRAIYNGPCRILGMRNSQYNQAVSGEDYVWFVIPEGHNIKRSPFPGMPLDKKSQPGKV